MEGLVRKVQLRCIENNVFDVKELQDCRSVICRNYVYMVELKHRVRVLSFTPCLFNKRFWHLYNFEPNLGFVAQGFQRMLFSEHCVEIFLLCAGVIILGRCVVNKVNISADVLLLGYSIFLALFVRSDVAELVTDRDFLKSYLKDCSMFTNSCCCFSVDSDFFFVGCLSYFVFQGFFWGFFFFAFINCIESI